MKVRITQEHIDKGERHARGRCPIALAIKERKGVIDVNILYDSAYIKYTKSSTTYFMSKEGSTFITLFDIGKKVKPFTLELRDKVNENS